MMIPKQLKDLKFCRIKKGTKKPFEKDWTNKPYSYEDISKFKGENYGVLCGYDNLIVIDFDNKELQEKLLNNLPETFTVKTGGGLFHLYYFTNNTKSFKIFDEKLNTLSDIQGEGKQVVGANSIHPNGKKYEVIKDVPIAFLDYSEIKANLLPHDKKPKKIEDKKKPELTNDFIDECKSNIKISDVISLMGIDTSKNPTECPFHSSKGGKCLGFQEDVAHCFHRDESWNISSLVKQWKNYDFKGALEFLADKFGLKDKLEDSRKKYNQNFSQDTEIEKAITNYYGKKDLAKQILKVQPLHYDRARLWWAWNKSKFKWEVVDDTDILIQVDSLAMINTVKTKERVEILEALKQESRKAIPKSIEPTWIQFNDLIVDIATGKEFEASPEYFVTNPLPYSLHKSRYVETPVLDRIFKEWVGEDYVKTLYEIIAYCMLPSYPLHRIFCFIGAGMNGKSCFLTMLRKFIGNDNVCSTELDTLLTSRFEITRLHKKLICQMGETNFSEMNKTSILKKLSGGDLIGFEYKRKDPFEEMNYAKIIIATNNLPTTTDKTVGFYRRWMIIDFPNQFSEKKDILKDIPEEEYQILAVKCLGILHDLLKNKEFTKEGSIEDRMKKYEDHSDPLEKFLKEYTEEDPNEHILKWEFDKMLNGWLNDNRFRSLSDVTIGKKMKEKGYEQGKVPSSWYEDDREIKKQIRAWLGIKLKRQGIQENHINPT